MQWIRTNSRIPNKEDADCQGYVWGYHPEEKPYVASKLRLIHWSWARKLFGCTYWMRTNLIKPEPPRDE